MVGKKIHQLISAEAFMPINNPKKEKKIDKESIIYALVFVLYFAIAILIFIYSTKFLGSTINAALSTPQNDAIEAKYGQLDLANYALVAKKIGLTAPNISQESALPALTPEIIPVTAPENIPSTTPEITTTTPEIVLPTTPAPIVSEIKPRIIITNSTLRSGLAASLKSKLQGAGFEILSTGNVRPSVVNTIIKIKASMASDSAYLAEIKKIVSGEYDFVIQTLDENANHEVEIIIGNK